MNFRTIGLGTAIVTAAIASTNLTASPAQALQINDALELGGQVKITEYANNVFSFDFSPINGVAKVTSNSSLPPFILNDDVNITSFSTPSSAGGFSTTPLAFLSDIDYLDNNVIKKASFTLTQAIVTKTGAGNFTNIALELFGEFNAGGTYLGEGSFVSTFRSLAFASGTVTTSFDADLLVTSAPTPIPTPALLPAALGMGAAALRKRRKQEEAGADLTPEPVEA